MHHPQNDCPPAHTRRRLIGRAITKSVIQGQPRQRADKALLLSGTVSAEKYKRNKIDIAYDGSRLPDVDATSVPRLEDALSKYQWWKLLVKIGQHAKVS
jgi:hypothetical protein